MIRKSKADVSITFRINSEFKDKLQERADEEGRTISNLIIKICDDYLKEIEKAKRTLGYNADNSTSNFRQ